MIILLVARLTRAAAVCQAKRRRDGSFVADQMQHGMCHRITGPASPISSGRELESPVSSAESVGIGQEVGA
jgi:hypothetical protein